MLAFDFYFSSYSYKTLVVLSVSML